MNIFKYKITYAFSILILIFFIGLLKGPIVPDEIQSKNCARNVDLPFNFGVTLNCDSGIYLRLASDLTLLFESSRVVNDRIYTPGNVEQSTPGSTLIVWLISKPIIYVWNHFDFFTKNLVTDVKSSLNTVYEQLNIDQTIDDSFANFNDLIPIYIGYTIFNALILFFCFQLYLRILKIYSFDDNTSIYICVLIGMIILINDVNKQFFYSPGPQIFRIFCPIFTIYFAVRILEDRKCQNEYLLGSLVTGFFMLFYYIFFVSFVTITFTFILSQKKKILNLINVTTLKMLFFSSSLFIIPSLVWFLICYLINHSVLIADMSHDGFGFFILVEKFNSIGFLKTFLFFIDSIIRTFHHSLIHSWMIVFLFFFPFLLKKLNLNYYQKDLLKICSFFSLFSILFFSFYSPITSRMVFSSFLVFLPFIGEISRIVFKDIKFKNLFFSFYFVIFIFYTVNTILKTEPFGWYNEKGSYFFIR
mgnify:CR=1 FL=1